VDPKPTQDFVEIGAGSGELTLPLARRARQVLAVEPDRALAGALRRRLDAGGAGNARVIEADFLRLNLKSLLEAQHLERVRVAGNLPYAAATAILEKLLSERDVVEDMVLMFQQEVAERLVAEPGTKPYGYLSVVTQQAARIELLLERIPPGAFRPKPKVYSALVRIVPRPGEPSVDPVLFPALVKALLAHRRKTIDNNVKRLRSPILDERTVRGALAHLPIDGSERAENLSVEAFASLSQFCSSRQ
jgi:16S rRNA (adenine1518-N6/adenine1519-N6)-dimethyltransferase